MRKQWKLCWVLVLFCVVITLLVTLQIGSKPDDPVLPGKHLRKLQEDSPLEETITSPHAKEEVRHIGFLKVHKAASSTMQNIFFRFGLKRNLTFVFTQHPNYFSRTSRSHYSLVVPRYRKGYDILCNHGVFNENIYSSILPADTTYMGIVRDPLTVFISAVNFYSQPSQAISYITKTPRVRIQNLIQHPEMYDKSFFSYTKNVMTRDFGFDPRSDKAYVDQKLQELGNTFKLVLIVEYFEESLILMKRFLNWKLQDILFIPNNVYSKTGESVSDLTPGDIEKFRARNALDYEVYNFFYKKFWTQFNAERSDIHMEVLNFKQVLNLVLTFCNGNDTATPQTMTVLETAWNEEFEVYASDCGLMKKTELVFIDQLRRIQGSELKHLKGVKVRRVHNQILKMRRTRYRPGM